MVDNTVSSEVSHALKPQVVFELRDPLGIARGMAESIPDVVDDLRRLSEDSSAAREIAAVLDELTRIADLIARNVTRAQLLVEDDLLPATERWHLNTDQEFHAANTTSRSTEKSRGLVK